MRKGYISAFQLVALNAFRTLFELAEGATGEPGCDTDSIFYSAAFQGGFDQFVIPNLADEINDYRVRSLIYDSLFDTLTII